MLPRYLLVYTTLGLVAVGVAQDIQSYSDDHTVPSVPLAMQPTGGATTQVSTGSVFITQSNFITGDEYRLSPVEQPRPAIKDRG